MEYLFDTTRAAVNLVFSGAIERYPRIRFILPHAGGLMPYFAWRLSVSPMIDKRLEQMSRDEVYARLRRFWYDNALAPSDADLRMPARAWRTRPDRVRQRLAVRQRARHCRGGEDLRGDPRCRRSSATRSTGATPCRFSRSSLERDGATQKRRRGERSHCAGVDGTDHAAGVYVLSGHPEVKAALGLTTPAPSSSSAFRCSAWRSPPCFTARCRTATAAVRCCFQGSRCS